MNMQKIRRVSAGLMRYDYMKHYYLWSDIEKASGVYNFEPILNHMKEGLPLVVRFAINYPGNGDKLPSWISANKYTYTSTWTCYEYDYNNEQLIVAAQNLAHAFAARFNGHPMILAVEAGMIGQYGEWTTFAEGGGVRFSPESCRRILEPWIDLLTMTPVLGRQPDNSYDQYAVGIGHEYPIGYFDDVIMYPNSANIDAQLAKYSLSNTWQTQLMGGEVYPPYGSDVLKNRVDELEAFIRSRHISYMDLSYTPANETERLAAEHIRSVIKTQAGYD